MKKTLYEVVSTKASWVNVDYYCDTIGVYPTIEMALNVMNAIDNVHYNAHRVVEDIRSYGIALGKYVKTGRYSGRELLPENYRRTSIVKIWS